MARRQVFTVWSHTGSSVRFAADTVEEYLATIRGFLGTHAPFDTKTYETLYNMCVDSITTQFGTTVFKKEFAEWPEPPKSRS